MYETYAALQRPSNSRQYLWRYYPFERLRDLIQSAELFFTHVPAFTDKLEGALTTKSRERLFRWFIMHGSTPATASKEVVQYEQLREGFYASCWHMSNHESYLMWRAYADRGFAVRTTFERVQASFEPFPGVISGGVVNYVNFERDDTELGNAFTHVTTKDLPYRDEREFRLFFWKPDPRNGSHEPLKKGVRIPVDLRFLVERVFISPFVGQPPPEVRDLLLHSGIEWTSSSISVRSDKDSNALQKSRHAAA